LDAALNYIDQAKSEQFNNGYFSPMYASLLRREAEALIMNDAASPEEIIALLDNSIDLYKEQHGENGRYLPIFYNLLVNYCKQNKVSHDNMQQMTTVLRDSDVSRLKREETFLSYNFDFVERDF